MAAEAILFSFLFQIGIEVIYYQKDVIDYFEYCHMLIERTEAPNIAKQVENALHYFRCRASIFKHYLTVFVTDCSHFHCLVVRHLLKVYTSLAMYWALTNGSDPLNYCGALCYMLIIQENFFYQKEKKTETRTVESRVPAWQWCND